MHEIDLPDGFNALQETREIINDYERARGMAYEWQSHRTDERGSGAEHPQRSYDERIAQLRRIRCGDAHADR